ncbi:MAG: SPOR domain-containing protein [Bacteroidales bacterium]
MNIVEYIIELLNEKEELSVPGLGIFTIEYKASGIHPIEHTFTPPLRNVRFENIITDDDLLARTISEKEKISIQEAIKNIHFFSDSLVADIQKGKLAGVEGLGVFSLTDDKLVSFIPETNAFSDESFGLTGFSSPAIIRSEFKDKAALIAQNLIAKKNNRLKKIKQYLIITASVLLVTAIIFLVFFTDIFRNYLYNNDINDSKKQQTFVGNNKITPVETAVIDTVKAEDTSQLKAVNTTTQNGIAENNTNISQNLPTQSNMYYLVAGSFKSEENANKSVTGLNTKGYKKAGIIRQGNNGMFIVFYESYSSKEEASKALHEILKSENKDSWVMKK